MTLDLEAERAASAERRGKVRAKELLEARARMLRKERGPGGRATKAEKLWPHFDEETRAAIIARADEMDQRPRMEASVTQMSSQKIKEIAKAYLQEHPHATSSEVWHHVCQQGSPSIKESSFTSAYIVEVRKDLGISGGASRPAARKRRRAQRAATDGAPTTQVRDETKAPPVAEPEPDAAPVDPPAVVDAPVAAVAEPEPTQHEPVERDAVAITTPGGSLRAKEQGSGWWYVSFEGPVPPELFRRIIADLVSPFTEGPEA